MEAFIEKFSRKYNLPAADCLRLIGLMERRVFRKGECVVRQGERNSDFYVVSRGIWLGHYLDDGADVSVWFAGEGEALFSTWGYVGNEVSKISIEAMCDAEAHRLLPLDHAAVVEPHPGQTGEEKGLTISGQPFFSASDGCHPPPRALYNPTSARCSLRTALLSSTCASKNFRWASSTSM